MKRRAPRPPAPLLAAAAVAAAALLAAPALLAGTASAHTTVGVGEYEIEAGWGTEPPVVGIRNTFVFEVSMPGEREGVKTGVRNAFSGMDATARFGGAAKGLDVSAAPTPGHYYSNVIPTRTGSYSVQFNGEIDGTPVDVDVPVEDVETTAVLDFPPRPGGGGGGEPGSDAVWAAIRQLQAGSGGAGIGGVGGAPQAPDAAGPGARGGDDPAAYDYAVVALSLAGAAVALSVVAMARRR